MSKQTISKMRQSVLSYLDEDQRITVKLQILLSQTHPTPSFLHLILQIIKKTPQPLKLFRLLIYLHRCYLQNTLPSQIGLSILQKVLVHSKPKSNYRLDYIIDRQVLPSYVLYLQKCYQYGMEGTGDGYQVGVRLYRDLNMLRLGLSFVDVLYTFGRYFQKQFQFVIDFNITIAIDFHRIYQKNIKVALKTDKKLWNQQMKLQLQKIHQKMYIVYYNCYYYKYVKAVTPRFIQTENVCISMHQSLLKKKMHKENNVAHSLNKSNMMNMSLSTAYSSNKSKALTPMTNSTLIGLKPHKPNLQNPQKPHRNPSTQKTRNNLTLNQYFQFQNNPKQTDNGLNIKYGTQIKSSNKNKISQSCILVSQFTCDLSDKKEQLVADLYQSEEEGEEGEDVLVSTTTREEKRGGMGEEGGEKEREGYRLLESMKRVVASFESMQNNKEIIT